MAGPIIPAGYLIMADPLIIPVPLQPVRLRIRHGIDQFEHQVKGINRIAEVSLASFKNAIAGSFHINIESLKLVYAGDLIDSDEKFDEIPLYSPIFGSAED